jgi:hypothetical protein
MVASINLSGMAQNPLLQYISPQISSGNVSVSAPQMSSGPISGTLASMAPTIGDRGPGEYYNPITQQGISSLRDPGAGYIKQTTPQVRPSPSIPLPPVSTPAFKQISVSQPTAVSPPKSTTIPLLFHLNRQ